MLSNCCATKLSFRLYKIENLKEVVLKTFLKLCTLYFLVSFVDTAVVRVRRSFFIKAICYII